MAMSGERDPARIDGLMSAIGAAWRANPELRLGQLVVSAAGDTDPFYIADDKLLAGLNAIADGPGYLGGDE
jgi:hypothetical protein